MPADILGIWSENLDTYIKFNADYTAKPFDIYEVDGEKIGKWGYNDVYFYEPGYNMVVYRSSEPEAYVYAVVELTGTKLVWCWVETIQLEEQESIGEIVGDIINKAQEGYDLNPELYQTFTKVSDQQFELIQGSLDKILQPWQPL